jgi:hypothetical protein
MVRNKAGLIYSFGRPLRRHKSLVRWVLEVKKQAAASFRRRHDPLGKLGVQDRAGVQ